LGSRWTTRASGRGAGDGRPAPDCPGPLGCVAVGVSLFFAAALVSWAAGVGLPPGIPKGSARVGTSILAAVFLVRAVGDRKYVGFFKRVRDTEFARRDSGSTRRCVFC